MLEIYTALKQYRIIPVVRIDDVEKTHGLCEALKQGGLPIAEITLRTECAINAIKAAAKQEDFLIGAGTVLNAEECESALNAGARFIVSPGLDEGVLKLCKEREVTCFPGVATASEIQKARNLGLETVKFFPAEPLGGTRMLKALAGPFHEMKFIPTGGINIKNATEYLQLPFVTAIGGSWMVKPELYGDGSFSDVLKRTQAACRLIGHQRQESNRAQVR